MAEMWDVFDKNGNKTGRLQKRGWMESGNYHLVVFVWIINEKGDFLISKRAPDIRWPNKWACTAGSVVAGDDSITTALKEVREELGVILAPENGKRFKQYRNDITEDCGEFIDVWIFRQEVDICSVVLQPDETCDAMWASAEKIRQLVEQDMFIPVREGCPYLDDLLRFYSDEGFKIIK